MESFIVDKSFYDFGTAEELKELWEADLDPVSGFFMIQKIIKLVFYRVIIYKQKEPVF